ncbi:MAG: hypothetical protein ACRENJ_01885 [Candidatus Eiseniibacteriota bacterium]
MDRLPTSTDPEIRLTPKGAGRWISAAFLFVWLCGWAAGEAFALWMLIRGAIALVTGTPPQPDRENLPWGPALAAGAFLLVWLSFWTVGGVLALREFLRLAWGADLLAVRGGGLEVTHWRGPFRSRREIPRDILRRLALAPKNDRLVAETHRGQIELSTLGTRAEREQAMTSLRALLSLGGAVAPGESGLPEQWQDLITPEGERVLVPNLATRRTQARVAAGAAMVAAGFAFVIGRAAMGDLSLLPGAILALAAAGALGWGAAWLARGCHEWRIGSGRLVLRRRFGARVQDRFEARRLELTVTSDSDGDDSYTLEGVGEAEAGGVAGPAWSSRPGRPAGKRRAIARALHDPSMPRSLGEWLARTAGMPFEDRTTREAREIELADLLAQLEASGRFGRWAAKAVGRLAEGRKKAG